MPVAIQGFDEAAAGLRDTHVRKGYAREVNEQDHEQERLEHPVEAMTGIHQKWQIRLEKHAGHEKEHWHVKRIDQLVGEGGNQREVIMSHHNQYNTDPFGYIHIINPFYCDNSFGNWFIYFHYLSLVCHVNP